MYIRVLCTIIYQSDDLALSASDKSALQCLSIYFQGVFVYKREARLDRSLGV